MQRQRDEKYLHTCINPCATTSGNDFISRPRWSKCGQYIEGGEERWKELSSDKTSDDMVDILLAEMTGTDIAVIQAGSNAAEEFFEGQVSKHGHCLHADFHSGK